MEWTAARKRRVKGRDGEVFLSISKKEAVLKKPFEKLKYCLIVITIERKARWAYYMDIL